MSISSTGARSVTRTSQIVIILFLFGLAFVPRVLNLTAYVAADEAKWILRSAHFLTSLLTGDFGAAASQIATPDVDVLAPAVTTMWAGALGLLAKYRAEGAVVPLTEYLAALPYTDSERVPLDFYPWLRFPIVLITSVFVVAFYGLSRKLFPGRQVALIAAILIALDPFFINHSRVIHHDALVAVFMSLSLLSLLVCLQQRGGRWWLVLSGVTFGLGVLTKPTALFLIPFVGLMGLWQTYSQRGLTDRTRHLGLWGGIALWCGIGLLTAVMAWPALWSDPVGTVYRLLRTSLTAAGGDNEYTLVPSLVPNRLPNLGILFYPVNLLLCWGILPTLGLVMILLTWRRERQSEDHQVKSSLVWLLLFTTLLMLVLTPLGTRDIRYYLPAWPALMLLAAYGLASLPDLTKPLVVAILSVLLLIPYYPYYITYHNPIVGGPYLAPKLVKVGGGEGMDQVAAYLNAQPDIAEKTTASTMLESFLPYYSHKVVKHHNNDYADIVVNYIRQVQNGNPSDEFLAYFRARVPQHTVRLGGIEYANIYFEPLPRPVRDVTFGEITLIAQTLDAPFAEPSQEYDLTLLWNVPLDGESAVVRVQVRDLHGRVWSEDEGPLLSPSAASAVEGHYTLAFPPDMPRGDYQLWVAVGTEKNWAVIGIVPVHRFAPPGTIPYPIVADFGELIGLRGYDISNRKPSPGETVAVTLHWQALQSVPRSYTTFVHLLDTAGNRVAQIDVLPGDGRWTTDTWKVGEWVTDDIRLTLPSTLSAGEYRLSLGWYDWQTSERLPLTGQEASDTLLLTALQVR